MEKNNETNEISAVLIGAIYTLLSVLISYGVNYAIYISIFMLSLGFLVVVMLSMSKTIEFNRDKKIDKKSEFIKITAKCVAAVLIYQLYLMDYVFTAGIFSAFAIINISTSIAKIMG